MKQLKPILHGRDHTHGGPDVVLIAWEALGSVTVAELEQPPPEPTADPSAEPPADAEAGI